MRKNILSLAAVAALSLAAVGSASAGTATDSFDITLQVDATCEILQGPADIYMIHDGTGGNTSGGASTAMGIVCNKDLPYTVEVDADFGGGIILTDAATSKSVFANLQIAENGGAMAPWASFANGGAFSSIGSGIRKDYEIAVNYSTPALLAVGVYTRTNQVVVAF